MAKAEQRRARAAKTPTVTLTRQTLEVCHQAVSRIPGGNAAQAFAVANALAELEAMLGAVPAQAAPETVEDEPEAKPKKK